ncbi:penicillin-binding protein activator [Aminobacter sp. AP02]|uniref:ABC transporter substrate-binding protein n=1 Tax=Aminobacter sp. AP02 TaxID=2135737 RepID=UPI000D7B186C|nr:penicillin-binding protein activator [Aminobacter sp. AP02]PWK76760.1 amino acid/amide ABC transporter substrate-binding protein (HAAT family) [Aminobacter sp. AP02]
MTGSGQRLLRHAALLAAVLALPLGLTACQSGAEGQDVLGTATESTTATAGTARSGPTRSGETLGKGPVKVSMLLPLSAGGTAGDRGRKMRDAAALAMSDMGDNLLTLTVEDTGGDEGRARKLTTGALASGAKLVIGPSEPGAVRQLATISGANRPLVMALADNYAGAPGVYSVRLNEADSAAAGAAAIAAKGARKFVLFMAEGEAGKTIEKRVANSLSIYGATLAVAVPFGPSTGGSEKAVADMMALVNDPQAIVIASGSANPAPLVSALRAKGMLGKNVALVGSNRWIEHGIDDPVLQGAHIATLDSAEIGPIADRFRKTYSYEPDVNVAYGYDTVALAAGIASALGPKGFTKQVIENPTGFRGSTGVFRFRDDGAGERAMPFFRIDKGKLKQVEKSTSGF